MSKIARSARKNFNFRPIFRLEKFDFLVVPPSGVGGTAPVRLVGVPPPPVAKNLASHWIAPRSEYSLLIGRGFPSGMLLVFVVLIAAFAEFCDCRMRMCRSIG